MRRMRRALLVAIALVVAVPAAAAERELDQPPRPATIAARGDVLAYSRWDGAIGAYRLRVAIGDDAPVDVPVTPRSVPFDVHVGHATEPSGSRRTVLVYSRCSREPTTTRAFPEQFWFLARGCRPYVTSLDGGERPIVGAGSGVLPGVSGRTLTLVRFVKGRRAVVIVRAFDRRARPQRVLRAGRGWPVDADLLNHRLALTRRHQGNSEVDSSALELIDTRTGHRLLIHTLRGGGQTAHGIVGASRLPHGGVAWAEICGGDPEGCVAGTELVASWTPRGGLHTRELPGVEAFARTPFASWALQGCDTLTYPEGPPCVLNRLSG